MSVLVLAAHPDDEVLGCGGTIAKLSDQGRPVYIAILGQGISSRFNSPSDVPREAFEKLESQSRRAAKLLGAEDVFFYSLPDNRFDTLPLLDIVKNVETLIEKLKPDTIFCHHCGDLNIDHQATLRAVLTATRPMETTCVKTFYSYEIPSSTEWAFDQFAGFSPNYFVDIRDQIEKKISAMALYTNEVRPFPHPRSFENIRALAQIRGAAAGCQYCEAFQLVRKIG